MLDHGELFREEGVEDEADEHGGEDEERALVSFGVVGGLRVYDKALDGGCG